eukprot:COSAG01_NODE_1112_length_11654_cov_8.254435_11_plen_197_part_00
MMAINLMADWLRRHTDAPHVPVGPPQRIALCRGHLCACRHSRDWASQAAGSALSRFAWRGTLEPHHVCQWYASHARRRAQHQISRRLRRYRNGQSRTPPQDGGGQLGIRGKRTAGAAAAAASVSLLLLILLPVSTDQKNAVSGERQRGEPMDHASRQEHVWPHTLTHSAPPAAAVVVVVAEAAAAVAAGLPSSERV